MLTYITEIDNPVKVTEVLQIEISDVQSISAGEKKALTDFIIVLAEVPRVSR